MVDTLWIAKKISDLKQISKRRAVKDPQKHVKGYCLRREAVDRRKEIPVEIDGQDS